MVNKKRVGMMVAVTLLIGVLLFCSVFFLGLLVSWKAYKDLNLEDRLWYVQKMHVKL